MALIELEGLHLGEKHKSYNKLFKTIVKGESNVELNEFNEDLSDIENLLKIDNACSKKNIEYILKVLVCGDILYVSRAIKQCQWLFNDKEYAHIINPHYLHTILFPKMCVKAKIKLIKSIQLNLRDNARVEEFYEYEDNPEKALYWLPHCSLSFIERKIVKHVEHMKPTILKRLCEKSITILEIYINNCPSNYTKVDALNATLFLLRAHTQKYLDIIEKLSHTNCLKFSASATKLIMKNCPSRILNNFERYCNFIHLPSFISYLKRENIKNFLLQLITKAEEKNISINNDVLRKFVEEISINERFEFIKRVFIDKEFQNQMCLLPEDERRASKYLYDNLQRYSSCEEYLWYKYAPFDVAFANITKMIENDVSSEDQKMMLNTLLISAGKDISGIQNIVQYVKKSKKITEFYVKYEFLQQLFALTNFKEFNTEMWDMLRDIVTRRNPSESKDLTYDVYQWAVIAHYIVNSEQVPESIDNNVQYNTMKLYRDKVNDNEKELIFEYLYKRILNKLKSQTPTSRDKYQEFAAVVEHALHLLVDWEKDLKTFPELIAEIKKFIETNIKNNYDVNLNFIYNINKSWRKYFFDESLYLCRNDSTFVNALKHDPVLLERYSNANKPLVEVAPIKTFLRKIRIYYPTWLEKYWSVLYKEAFDRITKHQTICFGICTLYTREELKKTLIEYAPKVTKLSDSDIDALALSYQRHLAKNMHFARPQPSPDLLFLYAKGDYLKYALPSLLAIFYNLSTEDTRKFLPKLLDSHVSLQKHGIRLAVTRLSSTESSALFYNLWKSNTNSSIRCVLFKVVFELTCKEENEDRWNDIWEVLKTLIEGLTLEENKEIYDLLFKVEKLPVKIQAAYYVTVYNFLKKLYHLKDTSESYKYSFNYTFVPYAVNLVDDLLPEFVKKILLEYINEEFSEPKENNNWEYSVIPLLSSFLLNSNDVEDQTEKYNNIFTPFYEECNKAQKYCKLSALLDQMRHHLPKIVEKKKFIPVLMLRNIHDKLQNSLSIIENYNMLTKWKLTVTFVENLQDIELTTSWVELCTKIAPEFGKDCSSMLKENSSIYFSYIYVLFSRALKEFLDGFVDESVQLDIYLNLLDDTVESHLLAIKLTPKRNISNDEIIAEKTKVLKNIFSQHPSLEVKIHYHESFREDRDSYYYY